MGSCTRPSSREAVPEDGAVEIGSFRAEFVRMAHSVPDNVAIMLEAGGMRVLHTSDYKLDHTPVDGLRTDVGKLAEIGNRGVDLMLGDSTNAERPGVTGSERLVGEAFRQIIPVREGRILVASFASNVHRMQQAVDVAVETGRKVCVIGRSMRKNLNIARNLGYLEAPDDTFIRPAQLEELAPHEAMILCTGSQGEPMSALTRIAYRDHPAVTVERGDTVILSAKPVPGNELRVHDTINRLAKAGAEVLHQEIAPVHVSGHGNSEEIRTVLGLVRPRASCRCTASSGCSPRTRSWRRRAACLRARSCSPRTAPSWSSTNAGRGSSTAWRPGVTFVDGLGVGDVRDVALRDRRHLSEHGVLIVVARSEPNGARPAAPELIARGFGDNEPLVAEMRGEAAQVIAECLDQDITEIKLLQEHIHDSLAQLVYDRTGRRPMILPVIVEV